MYLMDWFDKKEGKGYAYSKNGEIWLFKPITKMFHVGFESKKKKENFTKQGCAQMKP